MGLSTPFNEEAVEEGKLLLLPPSYVDTEVYSIGEAALVEAATTCGLFSCLLEVAVAVLGYEEGGRIDLWVPSR